jgi:hypothetical protein
MFTQSTASGKRSVYLARRETAARARELCGLIRAIRRKLWEGCRRGHFALRERGAEAMGGCRGRGVDRGTGIVGRAVTAKNDWQGRDKQEAEPHTELNYKPELSKAAIST